MEAVHNDQWHEVDVLRGDAKLELRSDAGTGKLLGSGPAIGEDLQNVHALDGSKLTFSEAIAHAERVGNGPALEANSAGHGDCACVDVGIIRNHGKQVAHYQVSMRGGRIHATLTGTDS